MSKFDLFMLVGDMAVRAFPNIGNSVLRNIALCASFSIVFPYVAITRTTTYSVWIKGPAWKKMSLPFDYVATISTNQIRFEHPVFCLSVTEEKNQLFLAFPLSILVAADTCGAKLSFTFVWSQYLHT